MTDLTLGLALLGTVGLCCLLIGTAIGRWRRDTTTPPPVEAAEIARLHQEPPVWSDGAGVTPISAERLNRFEQAMQTPVSSVRLPGTVPPAPAVIGAIVETPAPTTPQKHVQEQELPDSGRHHRSFDHLGDQDTRKVFLRRTRQETT